MLLAGPITAYGSERLKTPICFSSTWINKLFIVVLFFYPQCSDCPVLVLVVVRHGHLIIFPDNHTPLDGLASTSPKWVSIGIKYWKQWTLIRWCRTQLDTNLFTTPIRTASGPARVGVSQCPRSTIFSEVSTGQVF